MSRRGFAKRRFAFSLIELLCVMTIIAILTSLMLPAISKALRKARGVGDHLGGPGGIHMRDDEVRARYRQYRESHPNHGKLNRRAFVRELRLSPAAETWLSLSSVEYRPFAASDPPEQPVIIAYPSNGSGTGAGMYILTIGDLLRSTR